MRKVLPFILLLILFASCSTEDGSTTINIAVAQEPVTLDVMMNTSLTGRIIASGNIYEKLLVEDADGNIREELCSSYSLSDNNRTLTFIIRDGVLFHDGSVMTAEDVCASMNRYLDLYSMASETAGGARFEVIDERTVSITSENSLLFLPSLIASSPQEAIVMPSYLINGTDLVTEIIGTGPYKLSLWNPGEKIVLSAFDSYSEYGDSSSGRWGQKKARNEGLTYWFVPDSVTRLLGLETGQYDFINDAMSPDFQRIEADESLTLIDGDESGSIVLVFNKKEGPLTSVKLRRALSYALSSETLMAACYGSDGWSSFSGYMESSETLWSGGEENPYRVQDTEKAEELLEGEEVPPLRILTSNLSNLDRIAAVLKNELENVGLECEIITLDWASFIAKRNSSSAWDIYISAFTTVPLPQMKSYFSPSFPGWMEEESEAYGVIESISSASTIEEAAERWRNGLEILYDYAGVYVAGHYTTAYASSSELDNIIIRNGFYFWKSTKSEEE